MIQVIQMYSLLLVFRAGPFHSPKIQSPLAHLSGTFKQQSHQKQSPPSTMQKPNASLSPDPKTNGLHSPIPKSPKSSNNLISTVQEPDLNSLPVQTVSQKKKRKKKKRRHSEVEGDAESVAPPATSTQANLVDSSSEKKRKKKKKKRKREDEGGENGKEREAVQSHLEPPEHEEEEWGQDGIWSPSALPNAEQSKQNPRAAATPQSVQPQLAPIQNESESNQREPEKGSMLFTKKKKKKKMQLVGALQGTPSASERCVDGVLFQLF